MGIPSRNPKPDNESRVVVLDIDTISSAQVRSIVRELLARQDAGLVADAVQVTDELVSNAHRHGRSPRVCRLFLLEHRRCLRIEVDDNDEAEPAIRTPDRSGGLGMVLIDRLTTSWGVASDGGGKTVWAELSTTTVPHLEIVTHITESHG